MRLFFLGNTLSTIGDYALWLAAGIWVKELTGSTAAAGLSFLCLTCGTLLSPLTGLLVDQIRRRPLLIATNAVTGLLVLSLVTVHHADQVWLVYTVMFLYGLSSSVTSAATAALLPQLVPSEVLGTANGLTQALTQGQRLVTPALGVGLLSLYGGGAVALLDAGTFAAAVLCWAAIRVEEEEPQPPAGQWLRETTAGFAFLLRTPLLRQLTVTLTVALFVLGFFETLGIAVATVGLHHAPSWTGVIVTAMGITGIVGGMLAGPLMQRTGPGRLTALGLGVICAGVLAMIAHTDWIVIGGALLMGLGIPFVVVGALTAVQLNTPGELMGRVSGADSFLVAGGQSMGIATGAALISVLPYQVLCITAAAVLGLSAVYLMTRREQRAMVIAPVETAVVAAGS
ncbi:MFS transporter [Streptacidiphilus sp. MAP12-16]|uniref:MFS transporter n=1 Tax=Streptacidiphilus sp. MAP12-16 TaxID=3156300 RepID=UPI003515FDD0